MTLPPSHIGILGNFPTKLPEINGATIRASEFIALKAPRVFPWWAASDFEDIKAVADGVTKATKKQSKNKIGQSCKLRLTKPILKTIRAVAKRPP